MRGLHNRLIWAIARQWLAPVLLASIVLVLVIRGQMHRHGSIYSHNAFPVTDRTVRVAFVATPLESAIAEIARQSKADIRVNWAEMAAMGIKPGDPITHTADSVPIGFVLQWIMRDPMGVQKIGFRVDGKTVIVEPTAKLNQERELRVHDIGDLLAIAGPLESDRDSLRDSFCRLISDTVAREEWGKIATLKVTDDRLFIITTAESQWQIERLLQQMREFRLKPSTAPATTGRSR